MGTNFVPPNVSGGFNTDASITTAFAEIQTALSRSLNIFGDATSGDNQMRADLDMNSNRVLNHPPPSGLTDLLRLGDLPTGTTATQAALSLIVDAAGNYLSDNVEGALAEVLTLSKAASTAVEEGAALIGNAIQQVGTKALAKTLDLSAPRIVSMDGSLWERVTGTGLADDATGTLFGTTIIPDGGDGTVALSRVDYPVVQSKWFTTGDGVTDDTVGMVTLGALGKPVWFTPGVYLISGTVTLVTGSAFLANRDATVKLADNTAASLLNGSMLYALSESNITIDGMIIDGNKSANNVEGSKGDGIRIQDCSDVRVTRNTVKDVPRDGIAIARLIGGSEGLNHFIIENRVEGAGAAIMTQGGEGILVVEGVNAVIANNKCINNKLRGIEVEISSSTVEKTVVVGNTCNGNARGLGINGNRKMTVSANIFSGNTEYGIDIRTVSNARFTIGGNVVDDSPVGIYVENTDLLTLTGNVIADCDDGIKLNGATKIVINANVVDNSGDTGIEFLSGVNNDITITANYVGRSNQNASGKSNIDGNASDVHVAGNTVRAGSAATYGIKTAGSGWTVALNNLSGSGVTASVSDTASNSLITLNRGWLTEAKGSSIVTNGNTVRGITHGLDVTPDVNDIQVVGISNPTNDIGQFYIGNVTSTAFNIHVRNDPGASGWSFAWKVSPA